MASSDREETLIGKERDVMIETARLSGMNIL